MKSLFIFVVVFLLFCNFNFIYSLIDASDAQCLQGLLDKTGQSEFFQLDSGQDYCTQYNFNFDCDSLGNINELYFSDSKPYQFKPSDFDCFKNAPAFYQNGGNLTSDFFKNISAIHLSSFQMTSSEVEFNQVLYISNLTKFKDFSFFGINLNMVYINDLKTLYSFNKFAVSSNIIPLGTNLKASELIIYPSKWFDQTSYSNFTTYQNAFSLVINGAYSNNIELDFPSQLLDRSSISGANSLLFHNLNFKKPSDYLDFSKQTVSVLSFLGIGSNFFINGKIPFKNITNSKFYYQQSSGITDISNLQSLVSNSNTLLFSSNNLTNNMDEFLPLINGKLQSLQLSNNKLVGTLNERFCNILDLGLNGNKVGGILNSCYTCHFGPKLINSNLRTKVFANFTNFAVPTEPCKTIVPNLRFDYANNRTYLFGRDLGFSVENVYFQTTPTTRWYNDVPSESFYKLGTETSTFYVYFRFQGLNYTVTATPLQPSIDNIYISNDGNLTINGTNFNYNTSLIQVSSNENGNEIKCIITYSTFNQIFCSLETFDGSTIIDKAQTDITIDQLTTTIPVTIKPDFLNQYYSCNVSCGINGFCNTLLGICSCNQDFYGETCNIQQHFVSSIQHSVLNNNGGNVTLNGLFTSINNNPSVAIGTLNCQIIIINETTIVCNLESGGNGIQTTTVKQNGLVWSNKNSFKYLTEVKKCPNNCTSNGVCNSSTGICTCKESFKGSDCSSINGSNELPTSTPSINNELGSAIISNQEVFYDILITKLVEYNIQGETVKVIDLQNKWTLHNSKQNNSSISVFSQVVDSYYNTIIESRLEIIDKDSDYSFAGVDFKVESGSIKISIDISNYKYLSNLNTLQLQLQSNVTEDSNKKENNCNDKETTIEGFNDIDAINYIKIQKNGKILNGKLINYALSDSRPTLITSTIVDKSSTGITIGINLPHFTSTLSIDPDFQVLLQSTFKTSCGKSRSSYIIPLSVVLPVACVASIIAATIFIIKKRNETKEFNSIKLKINQINN